MMAQPHKRSTCTMRSASRVFRRASRRRPAHRPYARRLVLEQLEGRLVPATTFTLTSLVTDNQAVLASLGLPAAARTDSNLVHPWGMARGLNSGLWVAENGTGMAESFDGTGQAIQSAITIPGPGGVGSSAPTGVATNATNGFGINSGTQFGPSTELFATEDGTIAGW